jgi:hypothetical protein
VISGGGTMNREAAALGVPVYSIFAGEIGAVDRYLANSGKLTLIENISDIKSKINVSRRKIPSRPKNSDSLASEKIVDRIISILDQDYTEL